MKYNKIFQTVAVALTLVLLAVAIPATPVLAAGEYFELTPTHDKIGERIDVWGNYFTATQRLSIYFSDEAAGVSDRIDTEVLDYEQVVSSVYASGVGELTAYFLVPSKLTDGDNPNTKVTAGRYYVYLTNYGLKPIIAFDTFTVDSTGVITLDPDEDVVGTEVEIAGEGFDEEEGISIEYDGDDIDIESGDTETDNDGEFSCTIIIPESIAGDHTITVTGDDSDTEAEAEYTVEPQITADPESGAAGEVITISGTGFGDEVEVIIYFDGDDVADDETDRDGSFEATFEVPAVGSGSYDIEVVDEDDNSDIVEFSIAAAAVSLSPTNGYTGTEVTVSGSGFRADKAITITFDNEDVATATTDSYGKFTASFEVPARITDDYIVKASDGSNVAQADFSIVIGASLSPATSAASPGHVGAKVTISGLGGFIAGRTVTITYDGNQVTTAIVNADGTFSASFDVPPSTGGGRPIVVTDGTNITPFTFVMESTAPPIPQPLKPEMGAKASSLAYFDWEDVTDPSGVTYTLQIATKDDFSADSIVVEQTGITESEYTLAKEQKLKSADEEAPYYWRIRAVDDASNASGWTGAGKFTVGFSFSLPQWAIYTLIGVGALLLFILGYWIGRKMAYS